MKSWYLIGREQICHRYLAFVIDNKFYETGPRVSLLSVPGI